MSRPPAFQFYAKDWLASSRRQMMSLPARAHYLDLLCWQSQDGGLPENLEQIRVLLGVCLEEWPSTWAELEPCFPVDKDGKRRNHRLTEVVKESSAYHEDKRRAGSIGGKKSQAKRKQTASKPQAEGQAELKPASAVEPESKTNPTHPPLSQERTPAPAAPSGNGGATHNPTPVGGWGASAGENPRTPEPDAVHRLVAAGLDSLEADELLEKQRQARERLGGNP